MNPTEKTPEEKLVDFPAPFFYPTEEKMGMTIGFFLIPILGYLIIGTGYLPGASGTSTSGGLLTIIFLLATVPLYFSGLANYLCYSPLLAIALALFVSYFVACYITAKKIQSVIFSIFIYLLFIVVVFKLLTFLYLPPACN